MELTLGPILYEWKKEEVVDFYRTIAATSVDRVYLGEVICSRKRGLGVKDIESIARLLTDAGKKVVLSTLAVVSNEEELDLVRALAELPYPLEANDISLLNMVDPAEREVSAGPHITTYNVPSVEFLKSLGIGRVTFPVELPARAIEYIIRHTGVVGEVFSYGKLPLAFSWRCYTSRAYGLKKTECRRDCRRWPEGMEVKTLEGEPIFVVNGTSVLSAAVHTLVGSVDELREMGVGALRISPEKRGTERVIEIFRKRMDGAVSAEEALAMVREVLGDKALCNGWYEGRAGKEFVEAAGAALT